MADLSLPNLDRIRQQYPDVHDALLKVLASVNNVAQQANVAPVGELPTPEQHAGVSVKAGAGVLDVAISDPSAQYRGLHHFVDVSPDASFSSFQTISDGPSTNLRRYLGSGKYYVRTYSQYPSSSPSVPFNVGMVDATGSAEPEMQTSAKQGFGVAPYTTVTPPKRA